MKITTQQLRDDKLDYLEQMEWEPSRETNKEYFEKKEKISIYLNDFITYLIDRNNLKKR